MYNFARGMGGFIDEHGEFFPEFFDMHINGPPAPWYRRIWGQKNEPGHWFGMVHGWWKHRYI